MANVLEKITGIFGNSKDKTRIISEGVYEGDWLGSFICPHEIILPSNVRTINLIGNDPDEHLQFYDIGCDEFLYSDQNFSSETINNKKFFPKGASIFSVRSIITEGFRVYSRPDLRSGDNSNNWVLDNFLEYVGKKGFDNLCDEYSRNIGK